MKKPLITALTISAIAYLISPALGFYVIVTAVLIAAVVGLPIAIFKAPKILSTTPKPSPETLTEPTPKHHANHHNANHRSHRTRHGPLPAL